MAEPNPAYILKALCVRGLQLEYNFPQKQNFLKSRYMPKKVHHRSLMPNSWKSKWYTIRSLFTHSHKEPKSAFNLVLASKILHAQKMSHPLLPATYLFLFNSLSLNENFHFSHWPSLCHNIFTHSTVNEYWIIVSIFLLFFFFLLLQIILLCIFL